MPLQIINGVAKYVKPTGQLFGLPAPEKPVAEYPVYRCSECSLVRNFKPGLACSECAEYMAKNPKASQRRVITFPARLNVYKIYGGECGALPYRQRVIDDAGQLERIMAKPIALEFCFSLKPMKSGEESI